MNEPNPYATPQAPVANPVESIDLEAVSGAQNLIIASIGMYLFAGFARGALGVWSGVVGLVALVAALYGVLKLAGALGNSVGARILLAISMFLPLINLVVLLYMNSQATKTLRAGGYKVGLFGSKKG